MRLLKATEADSERLKAFYNNSLLPGHIDFKVHRLGYFSDLYRSQTKNFVTYMLLNENEEIEAIASLLFKKGFIKGVEQNIGYATDLRVANSRKAVLNWSQYFLPVIEQERAVHNCNYIFTVIAQGQRQAYNAFIHPRTFRRNMPRYYLYRKFNVVGLHGWLPFSPQPLASLDCKKAAPDDFPRMAEYMATTARQQGLAFHDTPTDFLRNIEKNKNLDYWITLSSDGRIVGCMALWPLDFLQKYFAENLSPQATTAVDSLRFFSWLGMTRKLFGRDRKLNIRFLSQIHIDNPDVFNSMLKKIFSSLPRREFLVYPNFQGDLLTRPARTFITSSISCGLYCILAPYDPVPDFLKGGNLEAPPEIELPFL